MIQMIYLYKHWVHLNILIKLITVREQHAIHQSYFHCPTNLINNEMNELKEKTFIMRHKIESRPQQHLLTPHSNIDNSNI